MKHPFLKITGFIFIIVLIFTFTAPLSVSANDKERIKKLEQQLEITLRKIEANRIIAKDQAEVFLADRQAVTDERIVTGHRLVAIATRHQAEADRLRPDRTIRWAPPRSRSRSDRPLRPPRWSRQARPCRMWRPGWAGA